MEFDVFISYSSINRGFVENMLRYPLEQSGFDVAMDYTDFSFGEWTEDNIRTAIMQCSWILLAMTPQWLHSSWCEFEARTAKATRPQGRLITVILDACQLPEYLKDITWCDLTQNNFYLDNMERLIERLRFVEI